MEAGMSLLLDANIWLELLLGQDKSPEVRTLLERADPASLCITDFSLHSIGVILTRLGRLKALSQFLSDLAGTPPVTVVRLTLDEVAVLPAISGRFGLDFDDAYQYAAATSRQLQLISFDKDFDHTDLKRQTPAQATRLP